jgi:hypothetical protein
MPTQIWKCNRCGAVFEQKLAAKECEKQHPNSKPDEYELVYRMNEPLPNKVVVHWGRKSADYIRRRRYLPSEPDYTGPRYGQTAKKIKAQA